MACARSLQICLVQLVLELLPDCGSKRGWDEGDGKAGSSLTMCLWGAGGSSIAPSFGAVINTTLGILSHAVYHHPRGSVPALDLLQICKCLFSWGVGA